MSDTAFIGIDPSASVRSMTCAVIDSGLRITTLTTASLDELARAVLPRFERAACAVNGPSGPNQALLLDPDYRQRVGLDPHRANYGNYRVCEYELRRRGIYVKYTSPDEEQLSPSARDSWRLYDRLRALGYVDYPRSGARRVLETNAQAVYTVLAGTHPYTKNSLEGQLQRQLLLHEEGLDLPDPIYSLQEWTRHRLLTGTVNMQDVLSSAQLDALAAAYTAYVVAWEPDRVTAVGDEREGQIVLPTAQLVDAY